MYKIERYIIYICLSICLMMCICNLGAIRGIFGLIENSIEIQGSIIDTNNSIIEALDGTCEEIEGKNDK